ncbi:methionyl-tRNA formyltransferase [Alkalispirillum mobile]|uniref:Methionyl-tRNA formyltransferase n=1 Tax=Alkalispirillum mobile TaxID=85925 RepID=A0A498BTY1_9GAMM|nr:methionyl-tRNA formyltransferase [Alkalispirillum mobile]RLK47155.1 methionyl-tRNA formyltransferase [Alkalispirillum mobile]
MSTTPPRLVFAGTPDFAVPSLQALLDAGHRPLAVYTQPDRRAGRGRKPRPSPVKALALAHDLPVHQPQSLRDPAAQAELAALQPDLMVVIAYGLILPEAALQIPRLGCVNLHASLLPRWRGAAPVQRAILAGDTETGVCLMQMEAGLDTGPVLARARCPIGPRETGGGLHDRLAALSGAVLRDQLDDLLAGRLRAEPQPEAGVCYAEKLRKDEAWLDWSRSAAELDRQVRAFNPWPVAQTGWQGQVLRIWEAEPESEPGAPAGAEPGQVLAAADDGIRVATGEGQLRLLRLQAAGGRPLGVREFLNGRAVQAGDRLG